MQSKTPSPLIPQGTFLNQKGKSHIRIAVFTILAVHVVVLGALLLQGCKRTTDTNARQNEETNAFAQWPPSDLPPLDPITNTPSRFVPPPPPPPPFTEASTELEAPPIVPETATIAEPPPPPVSSTIVEEEPPPTPTGTEHVIIQGDSFYSLAQKYGVSTKAIANANPNVDPRRLQIGQKVYVPAPDPSTASAASSTANGARAYTVKSGDTLTRIASQFGTTVRALRSANNLSTDRIVVGQKLTIPGSPGNP